MELAVSEDEHDNFQAILAEMDMNDVTPPSPGGPFSALIPSMWPQDLMTKISHVSEDPNSQAEFRYSIIINHKNQFLYRK